MTMRDKDKKIIYAFYFVCKCFVSMCACLKGQKNMLDQLECGCWGTNMGSLQHQEVLLTTQIFTMPLSILNEKKEYGKIYLRRHNIKFGVRRYISKK